MARSIEHSPTLRNCELARFLHSEKSRVPVTLQYPNSIKRNRMGDGKHNGNDYINWWIHAFAHEFHECQQINGRMRICLSLPTALAHSLATLFSPWCVKRVKVIFHYILRISRLRVFTVFFFLPLVPFVGWCCVRRYNAKVIILLHARWAWIWFVYIQTILVAECLSTWDSNSICRRPGAQFTINK